MHAATCSAYLSEIIPAQFSKNGVFMFNCKFQTLNQIPCHVDLFSSMLLGLFLLTVFSLLTYSSVHQKANTLISSSTPQYPSALERVQLLLVVIDWWIYIAGNQLKAIQFHRFWDFTTGCFPDLRACKKNAYLLQWFLSSPLCIWDPGESSYNRNSVCQPSWHNICVHFQIKKMFLRRTWI